MKRILAYKSFIVNNEPTRFKQLKHALKQAMLKHLTLMTLTFLGHTHESGCHSL